MCREIFPLGHLVVTEGTAFVRCNLSGMVHQGSFFGEMPLQGENNNLVQQQEEWEGHGPW